MVNYILEDNRLKKSGREGRCARVVSTRPYTENDLAEAISERNIGISKPEAIALLEAVAEIQLEWLRAGNSINLRLVRFHQSIPGVYTEDEYPTEGIIRVTASKEVAKAAKGMKLKHVKSTELLRVDFVKDLWSETTNRFITGGGSVKIAGYNLKILGTNPDVCIEFISVESPKVAYPVRPVDIINNNPSELTIIAPRMTADETVQLRVTTQFSGKNKRLLKASRSVTFDRTFTVR
jgi:hypothetical protein